MAPVESVSRDASCLAPKEADEGFGVVGDAVFAAAPHVIRLVSLFQITCELVKLRLTRNDFLVFKGTSFRLGYVGLSRTLSMSPESILTYWICTQ